MAGIQEFSQQLFAALEAKTQWYDNEQLPAVLEQYRLIHTCVTNLYKLLVQKSKIIEDPYKHEKKISEVVAPENSTFAENERSVVLGTRFSDYESMLDFICSYFNFSVSYMNLNRIKSLVELNNSFIWTNLSLNSASPNTRGLAELILQLRQETDPMTVSTINDEINKNAQAFDKINAVLKDLTDFQHEIYKGLIRKNIFEHPSFDAKTAFSSAQNEIQQIKKIYASVLPKTPFYSVLIEEIISEDQSTHKDDVQAALLAKLKVAQTNSERKTSKIDSKQMLMDAIFALSSVGPQISLALAKVKENHDFFENLNNTGFEKLLRVLRKAFNIADPEVIYQVYLTDPVTKTEHKEQIQYIMFVKKLMQLERYLSSLSVKTNPLYKKLESSATNNIIDFLNNNITECQKILLQLTALDDFFKTSAPPNSSLKVKGMKMELTTLKNALVKVKQKRAEYTSYVEEENQMKKLGITNEE